MTVIGPDNHDETTVIQAVSEQGYAFAQRVRAAADAMPAPSLAQLQDAVDMLSPAETDDIIREGEDIEFGYAALELAEGLSAIGNVSHALKWLRVAADRDIPGAQEQLNEATRRYSNTRPLPPQAPFRTALRETPQSGTSSQAAPRLGTDASILATPLQFLGRGRTDNVIASARAGVEDEQAGSRRESDNEAEAIRLAKDTAARIIDDAHARADRIIAEARASREPAHDSLRHVNDVLNPQRFTDVAPPLVVQGLPGTGKTQLFAQIVSQAVAKGERCLVVVDSYASARDILWRLDHLSSGTTGHDNTRENTATRRSPGAGTWWPAVNDFDLDVEQALTSLIRSEDPQAEQSKSLLLPADLRGPRGELIHMRWRLPEATLANDLVLPGRRLCVRLNLPNHQAAEPEDRRDRLSPGPMLRRALDHATQSTDNAALTS